MQCHDAAAQIVIAAALETGLFHHRLHLDLIRVHADGFCEVAVAGLVAGHQTTEPRQYAEGIQIVEGTHQRQRRLREFEHQQPAARPQHPRHGGQGRRLVGDVAQPEADAHAVEAARREGQALGVGLYEAHVAAHARVEQPRAAALEHARIDVRHHDAAVRAHLRGEGAREIAGAGGDVQAPVPGAQTALLDREALPQPMRAQRHQVVHQVVAIGDGIEHAAHALALVAPRRLPRSRNACGARRRPRCAHRFSSRGARDRRPPGARDSVASAPAGSCRARRGSPTSTGRYRARHRTRADGVLPDRLDCDDADVSLPSLQHFRARAVSAYFRRRRVHAQIFCRQREGGAVVEGQLEAARLLAQADLGRSMVAHGRLIGCSATGPRRARARPTAR